MNESLQSLQDNISALSGAAIMCVGSDGTPVTELSGNEKDLPLFREIIPKESILSLVKRVSESPLEDQAVEETERSDVKYAAVSVLTGTRPVITWVVTAAFSDITPGNAPEGKSFESTMEYKSFLPLLDTLREASLLFIETRSLPDGKTRTQTSALEDAERVKEIEIYRSEAMMRIIRLLESDDEKADIMDDVTPKERPSRVRKSNTRLHQPLQR